MFRLLFGIFLPLGDVGARNDYTHWDFVSFVLHVLIRKLARNQHIFPDFLVAYLLEMEPHHRTFHPFTAWFLFWFCRWSLFLLLPPLRLLIFLVPVPLAHTHTHKLMWSLDSRVQTNAWQRNVCPSCLVTGPSCT